MSGKKRNKSSKDEKDSIIKGDEKITVGTKLDAKDFLGEWYPARVIKIKSEEKMMLVHFDKWSSRFDVWLPYNSDQIRLLKSNKTTEKKWRLGDRIIAKWGPAAKMYPATVSKFISESIVEVTFYDGVKKNINKASLKPDTEKLYRKYCFGSPRKKIVATCKLDESTEQLTPSGRGKRKLSEPASMADYITELHSKKQFKVQNPSIQDVSENTLDIVSRRKSSLKARKSLLSSSQVKHYKNQDEKEELLASEEKGIVKYTQVAKENEIKDTDENSKCFAYKKPLLKSHFKIFSEPSSGVAIMKKNAHGYVMFPLVSDEEKLHLTPIKNYIGDNVKDIDSKKRSSLDESSISSLQMNEAQKQVENVNVIKPVTTIESLEVNISQVNQIDFKNCLKTKKKNLIENVLPSKKTNTIKLPMVFDFNLNHNHALENESLLSGYYKKDHVEIPDETKSDVINSSIKGNISEVSNDDSEQLKRKIKHKNNVKAVKESFKPSFHKRKLVTTNSFQQRRSNRERKEKKFIDEIDDIHKTKDTLNKELLLAAINFNNSGDQTVAEFESNIKNIPEANLALDKSHNPFLNLTKESKEDHVYIHDSKETLINVSLLPVCQRNLKLSVNHLTGNEIPPLLMKRRKCKKFEDKYELFKKKWKEEKEKRRKALQNEHSETKTSDKHIVISRQKETNKSSDIFVSEEEDKKFCLKEVAAEKFLKANKESVFETKVVLNDKEVNLNNHLNHDSEISSKISEDQLLTSKLNNEINKQYPSLKPILQRHRGRPSKLKGGIVKKDAHKLLGIKHRKKNFFSRKNKTSSKEPDLDISCTPNIGDTLSMASMVIKTQPYFDRHVSSTLHFDDSSNSSKTLHAGNSTEQSKKNQQSFLLSVKDPTLSDCSSYDSSVLFQTEKPLSLNTGLQNVSILQSTQYESEESIIIIHPSFDEVEKNDTFSSKVKKKVNNINVSHDLKLPQNALHLPENIPESILSKDKSLVVSNHLNEIDLTDIKLCEKPKEQKEHNKRLSVDFIAGQLKFKQKLHQKNYEQECCIFQKLGLQNTNVPLQKLNVISDAINCQQLVKQAALNSKNESASSCLQNNLIKLASPVYSCLFVSESTSEKVSHQLEKQECLDKALPLTYPFSIEKHFSNLNDSCKVDKPVLNQMPELKVTMQTNHFPCFCLICMKNKGLLKIPSIALSGSEEKFQIETTLAPDIFQKSVNMQQDFYGTCCNQSTFSQSDNINKINGKEIGSKQEKKCKRMRSKILQNDEKETEQHAELSFSGYTPIIPAKRNIEVSPNIDKKTTLIESTETESESEDELPSVDDCVKCLCKDDCELGFMIQCEQCLTWQHGECVGYAQPKDVPLFYLCHICSKPRGLRNSSMFDNDYTWHRHGQLPPVSPSVSTHPFCETVPTVTLVNNENKDILSTILMVTHAMITDLYTIREVLQEVRNRYQFFQYEDTPNHFSQIFKPAMDNSTMAENIDEDKTQFLSEEIQEVAHIQNAMVNGKEKKGKKEGCYYRIDNPFNKDSLSDTTLQKRKLQEIYLKLKPNDQLGKMNSFSNQFKYEDEKPNGFEETNGKYRILQEKLNSTDKIVNRIETKMDSNGLNFLKVFKKNFLEGIDHILKDHNMILNMVFGCYDFKLREESALFNVPDDICLLARYKLLLEVETTEKAIDSRLKLMDQMISEIEIEYDAIDQSKAVLDEFKNGQDVTNLTNLLAYLHLRKWTRVIDIICNSKEEIIS